MRSTGRNGVDEQGQGFDNQWSAIDHKLDIENVFLGGVADDDLLDYRDRVLVVGGAGMLGRLACDFDDTVLHARPLLGRTLWAPVEVAQVDFDARQSHD